MDSVLEDISYTPASLLHVFNSALAPSATKKIILLKGIYLAGRGVTYAGFFYDTLKDETTDAVVTLVVPALLRNGLTHNKTIEFYGYITKRVVLNGGRIEVHAVMTQLLQQTVNTYSEKEIRAVEVLQRKAELGYGDVEGFLKGCIVNEQTVRVRILIGKTAIIDSDISHALEEAVGFYAVSYERINLSSEAEILQALRLYNHRAANDLLVLSRGGGENMEVFNSPDLAAFCLELEPLFVTAIGHKEDVSLVQKVADKAFITPTAFGQYLNRLYNETVAELQNSKARLVEAITVQLAAQYNKQVSNLEEKMRGLEELNGQRAGLARRELEMALQQVMAARGETESALGEIKMIRVAARRRRLLYWGIVLAVVIAEWIFLSWRR
jgi:exodeoxyribonuclease VII large subunit